MLAILWNVASFIIALGILVAVHEWGHFIVARWCKVHVQRFSIGFGKVLFRRTDKYGTEFAIAAIPLGGYVKMLDSRVEDVTASDQHKTFNSKSVAQRFAIVFAGPLVNFIFAILALACMYMIGLTTVKPVIGTVTPYSIAADAGMQPNMQIVAIAGRETLDWEAVNLELVSHIGDPRIELSVTEEGTPRTLFLNTTAWDFAPDKDSAFTTLGFRPYQPSALMSLGRIAENSPASRAELAVGDIILQIDGTLFSKWEQIVAYVQERPGQDVFLTIGRNGDIFEQYVTLGYRDTDNGRIGILGVNPEFTEWPEEYIETRSFGPITALGAGIDKTWRLMTLTTEMLVKLVTGDISVKTLSGPASIAQGAGVSASYGIVYFLSFLALISVNLGILNLLPLPMLDGGHLMYFIIEAVRGKPVPEHIQEIGFRFGAVILFGLMGIAIINDIMRFS